MLESAPVEDWGEGLENLLAIPDRVLDLVAGLLLHDLIMKWWMKMQNKKIVGGIPNSSRIPKRIML